VCWVSTFKRERREGGVTMRGDTARSTTADQRLLDTNLRGDWKTRDAWRALRILSEFVEGFDTLAELPSAVSVFGFPVQCFVLSPFRWSAIDQMLKYGSCATRGTAGGRICVCASPVAAKTVRIVRSLIGSLLSLKSQKTTSVVNKSGCFVNLCI